MQNVEDIHNLPIDITFTRLGGKLFLLTKYLVHDPIYSEQSQFRERFVVMSLNFQPPDYTSRKNLPYGFYSRFLLFESIWTIYTVHSESLFFLTSFPESKRGSTSDNYDIINYLIIILFLKKQWQSSSIVNLIKYLFFFLSSPKEWLVDRKRIPSDWRKRLAALRTRISTAFASLPKDIDPFIQTLDPEG